MEVPIVTPRGIEHLCFRHYSENNQINKVSNSSQQVCYESFFLSYLFYIIYYFCLLLLFNHYLFFKFNLI